MFAAINGTAHTNLKKGGEGRGAGATMGQVCFTTISSNRACPTVFIASVQCNRSLFSVPAVRVFNGWG